MFALFRRAYHSLVPPSVRPKVWRVRANFRRRLVDFTYRISVLRGDKDGRCIVCRGKNLGRFSNPAVAQILFSFYKCRDCGFIFVAPTPNLANVYAETTMPEFGEGEQIWNTHYLDSINKHTGGKGKLLEIGFGNASFLQLAQANGWEVYGTEMSNSLAVYAQEQLKLPNIQLGSIEEIGYPDNFFDVVSGFNFIEHVPDPRKTLEEIWRILRPGGIAALMCPNISGIYHQLMPEILADNDPLKITWVPPYHLSYFSKENLRILLQDVGFSVAGDESHLMSSLWRQFEVNIGPKATAEKLEGLASRIQSSTSARGDARVEAYKEEIKQVFIERMTWTMLSDLTWLEPLLGAEVGILFVAKKLERKRQSLISNDGTGNT